MKQVLKFMKTPKGIILIVVLFFSCLCVAFTNNTKVGAPNSEYWDKKQKIITSVAKVLEYQHFSPKEINDSFSIKLYNIFLKDIDPDKSIFIQSDITDLDKYKTKLDDELHGEDIAFLPAFNKLFNKRIDELKAAYKNILTRPFNFETNEVIINDNKKETYPKNNEERLDKLRKRIKLYTLEKYVDLKEARKKATEDSITNKSDEQLEVEARKAVVAIMNRYFRTIEIKLNEEQRFNAYVNCITKLMDPHTNFMAPVDKRAFDEQMSNQFFGIGAQLGIDNDGTIKVVSVLSGGPAWKQGELQVNDILLKIGQGDQTPVDIEGYDILDAVKLIRGKQGSQARITVKKLDGTIKTIAITRAKIEQDEGYVKSSIIHKKNEKIGYIFLPDFYADFTGTGSNSCSEDMAKEILKLKSENINGLIIDLRYNGGGSLYEVIQMLGLFLPKSGPVVQVAEKNGVNHVLNTKAINLYTGPLTVLVNEYSASASEIFAAAIQDYHRGIILGSSTYGKGTVQRNVNLGGSINLFGQQPLPSSEDMGTVKLTFQKFYRINGGSTQLKGVTPDVIFPEPFGYLKETEKQNETALFWDEIPKATYNTLSNFLAINTAGLNKAQEIADKEVAYTTLKNNISWLDKKLTEPKSLNINKYIEEQKVFKNTIQQNKNVVKSKEECNVTVLNEDYDKYYHNPDKLKGERYKDWLNSLKTDLFINNVAEIMASMLAAQKQTASILK